MRIVPENLADQATLTCAPTPLAEQPVTHLQDLRRQRMMRTVNAAEHVVSATWGAPQRISCIGLFGHNMRKSNARWRVELFSDDAWTNSVYDSSVIPMTVVKGFRALTWRVDTWRATIFSDRGSAFSVLWLEESFAIQSLRITLSDTANPEGYLEAYRLLAGLHWQPSRGPAFSATLQVNDPTELTATAGGTLAAVSRGAPTRKLSMELRWMTRDADARRLVEMLTNQGKRKQMLVSLFPGANTGEEIDHNILGRISDSPQIAIIHPQRARAKLTFTEG
ncbi:hypothetical protein [Magnetofaba australis]|uniref:Uncharacterized protein n=1 Tax=Magnetofaba australis IT-1 TaxID=1434232 RepID=A0A1Y2K9D1_9PROT|nr:hypothetical protein [Magnetofaba australis]OSM07347.1 hypothetical protein MAIT1_04431 [Magnetofaba australis IT-1]